MSFDTLNTQSLSTGIEKKNNNNTASNAGDKKKQQKRVRNYNDLSRFVQKVFRKHYPSTKSSSSSGEGADATNNNYGITDAAMRNLDSFAKHVIEIVVENCNNLLYMQSSTLKTRTVLAAVTLTFGGSSELSVYARNEGAKAYTLYKSPKGSQKQNQSKKAGLLMPVARIIKIIKRNAFAKRVAPASGVILAAVIEYLCSEWLRLAVKRMQDSKRVRITPRHLQLALSDDQELARFFTRYNVTIGHGAGVNPFIDTRLIKTKKQPKQQQDDDEATLQDAPMDTAE